MTAPIYPHYVILSPIAMVPQGDVLFIPLSDSPRKEKKPAPHTVLESIPEELEPSPEEIKAAKELLDQQMQERRIQKLQEEAKTKMLARVKNTKENTYHRGHPFKTI